MSVSNAIRQNVTHVMLLVEQRGEMQRNPGTRHQFVAHRQILMRRLATTLAIACAMTAINERGAHAADIRVLASNGVKAAVEQLKPQLEKASGSTLSIRLQYGGRAARAHRKGRELRRRHPD
jgi:hypothetical protein